MDTDDIYESPYKTLDYHYVHLHKSTITYIFTSQGLLICAVDIYCLIQNRLSFVMRLDSMEIRLSFNQSRNVYRYNQASHHINNSSFSIEDVTRPF